MYVASRSVETLEHVADSSPIHELEHVFRQRVFARPTSCVGRCAPTPWLSLARDTRRSLGECRNLHRRVSLRVGRAPSLCLSVPRYRRLRLSRWGRLLRARRGESFRLGPLNDELMCRTPVPEPGLVFRLDDDEEPARLDEYVGLGSAGKCRPELECRTIDRPTTDYMVTALGRAIRAARRVR